MSTATGSDETGSYSAQGSIPWQRTLRLWAGLILFAFVATHLLNHAVGVFGVDAMERVQVWRVYFWQTLPGTFLLYGAAVVHVFLVLKRLVLRSTWRVPFREALQIGLGLLIPVLIYEHVIATRVLGEFAGGDGSYTAMLRQLWPNLAWSQTALLLVAWGHGIIGIHYMWRGRSLYQRFRVLFAVLAVLVPMLALAGFVAAGREALEFDTTKGQWTPEQIALFRSSVDWAKTGLISVGAIVSGFIFSLWLYRRAAGKVTLRYTGHGDVTMSRGLTLLEASRANGVPHPSVCGGRGRCSTCRVLILKGLETLDPPKAGEAAMLKRISAPARVRLACQIRPKHDLSVQVLLPASFRNQQIDWDEEALKWGDERRATVLVVDIRAFTKLTKTQLPQDLVVLLNRFSEEMRQAIEAHGGRVTNYMTDGMMAVFGHSGGRHHGARSAMAAANDMLKSMERLNHEFEAALPMPLRVGIGLHTGPLIMARIGDDEHGYMVTALGETVTIAASLEAATKERLADCLVSQETLIAAKRPIPQTAVREIIVPQRAEAVLAFALSQADAAKEAA